MLCSCGRCLSLSVLLCLVALKSLHYGMKVTRSLPLQFQKESLASAETTIRLPDVRDAVVHSQKQQAAVVVAAAAATPLNSPPRAAVKAIALPPSATSEVINRPALVTAPTVSHANATIPPILHFVYVSRYFPPDQGPLPAAVLNTIEGWRTLLPHWEIKIWNNTMVRQHFPEVLAMVQEIKAMAWVSDLIRYRVLYAYGGVYLDTDTTAIRSIDSLRSLGGFAVCELPPQRPPPPDKVVIDQHIMDKSRCKLTANGIIGVTPQHPALHRAIQKSTNNTIRVVEKMMQSPNSTVPTPNIVTGPYVWWAAIRHDPTVNVLLPYTFLPCDYTRTKDCILDNFRPNPHVFAMHEWAHSWARA